MCHSALIFCLCLVVVGFWIVANLLELMILLGDRSLFDIVDWSVFACVGSVLVPLGALKLFCLGVDCGGSVWCAEFHLM